MSNDIRQAQDLLNLVKGESEKIDPVINSVKTKFIALNSTVDIKLVTNENEEIDKVEDFKYFRSFVMSSMKDIKVCKAKAWKAMNDMSRIWKSDISRSIKEHFFLCDS